MSSVIASAALAPVVGEPAPSAEQVTQLVLGETAAVVESAGEWRRVTTDYEGYTGWVHTGYLLDVTDTAADTWRRAATGWSGGATLYVDRREVRVPLRARLAFTADGRGIRFPDGREGRLIGGAIDELSRVMAESRALSPEMWALEHFAGAPYIWGGVTAWGVDCSGLVQTTFAARGVVLPRDSSQQIECGVAVPLSEPQPGDLLFFRSERGPHIAHVAFAGPDDSLIHSTIARGGVVMEPRLGGVRSEALLQRLAAVRRIERHG